MSSLVDYEDSDSEEMLDKDKSISSRRDSLAQDVGANQRLHLKRPITMTHDGRYVTKVLKAPSSPNVPPQKQPNESQSVQTSVALCSKRVQAPSAGLRPYVSKRQRLITQLESTLVNHEGSSDQKDANLHILSEVSEGVRLFLGKKASQAELPRRVQHHLHAHQGPVNTVQWCPVPHFSHLLLSASMDKTLKLWDGAASGRCVQTYSTHSGAVRDACWMPCGRRLLSGSFDNTASLVDVETAQVVAKVDNQFKVSCLAYQPLDPTVFLCGGFSSEVKAWDSRTCQTVRVYKAGIQQTLDILFLGEGKEFVTSSDAVSRDSADRTLIAWDFATTAKLSNQIFHERYTCPSLSLHPQEDSFVAQTNGNYIALFSAQRPYRINKKKRFEGHKVEGYAVQCELSSDGTILATGSSTGSVHFYDFHSSRTLSTLRAHQQACVCVSFHHILPAVIATCDWGGEIKIWN